MKILLTGGLGYIGSHTAVELLKNGYEVEVFDNLYNSSVEVLKNLREITQTNIRFHHGDLLDYNMINKVLANGDYDGVIHFAGYKAVGESVAEPLKYYENNVGGTINLLKAMENNNVKNLIFSSSACVYSANAAIPYTEESELNPSNPYGRTKLVVEQILKDTYNADPSNNITVLRYFNPIGAHESGLIGENPQGIPNNLMPYITRVALGKLDRLSIFGNDYDTPDGTGVRDYIHVVDLAVGHVKALENIDGFNVYNLGSGQGHSVLEVLNTFNEICGNKVQYNFAPRRQGDIGEYYCDPHKAKDELDFETTHSLHDMCESSYRFELNQAEQEQ